MEKPTQFTIVSAVPFISDGAFCATNVENRGESATTTIPQIIKNRINRASDSIENINGEIRQQRHDMSNAIKAVRFVPND